MEIVLLVCVVLAGWHLLYEAVIARALRMSIRYRLFAHRDHLRAMAKERSIPRHVFELFDNHLNVMIGTIPLVTIGTLVRVQRRLNTDHQMARLVRANLRIFDTCDSDEFQAVRRQATRMFASAVAVNSGGWAIYFLPVVLLLMAYRRFKSAVEDLISIPSPQMPALIAVRV